MKMNGILFLGLLSVVLLSAMKTPENKLIAPVVGVTIPERVKTLLQDKKIIKESSDLDQQEKGRATYKINKELSWLKRIVEAKKVKEILDNDLTMLAFMPHESQVQK